MTDVEAMLWVLGLDPELREAKRVGLAALRAEMYERNLQVGGARGARGHAAAKRGHAGLIWLGCQDQALRQHAACHSPAAC